MGIKEETSEIYVIVANEPVSEAYASTWTVEAYNNKHVADVVLKLLEILLKDLLDSLLSRSARLEETEMIIEQIMVIDPQFPGLDENGNCLVSYDLHTTKFTENETIH